MGMLYHTVRSNMGISPKLYRRWATGPSTDAQILEDYDIISSSLMTEEEPKRLAHKTGHDFWVR